MTMTPVRLGARFIGTGCGMFMFGLVMSFGMVGHYIVGARWPTGEVFLKNISLWFACPWTLSTAVVLLGSVGLVAMGCAYAALGRATPDARVGGVGALTLCYWALIAMFLTGYVGYFAVDRVWPSFYYSPITTGKNVWLGMQLACMVAYFAGVAMTSAGIRRLGRELP